MAMAWVTSWAPTQAGGLATAALASARTAATRCTYFLASAGATEMFGAAPNERVKVRAESK